MSRLGLGQIPPGVPPRRRSAPSAITPFNADRVACPSHIAAKRMAKSPPPRPSSSGFVAVARPVLETRRTVMLASPVQELRSPRLQGAAQDASAQLGGQDHSLSSEIALGATQIARASRSSHIVTKRKAKSPPARLGSSGLVAHARPVLESRRTIGLGSPEWEPRSTFMQNFTESSTLFGEGVTEPMFGQVRLDPPQDFSMTRFQSHVQRYTPAFSPEENAESILQQARSEAARRVAEALGDGPEGASDTTQRKSLLNTTPAPSRKGIVANADASEWLEDVLTEFGQPPHEILDTAHRGITLSQLCCVISFLQVHCHRLCDAAPQSQTFGIRLNLQFANLYHVEHWLIRPPTKGRRCGDATNCSFVELLATARQTPTWYVSHWWGEPHYNFVRSIEEHVGLRGLGNHTPFWICAYANRQHSVDTEVTRDPRHSSFYRAMKLADGLLLVLDEENTDLHTGPATPFSRIWCSFEQAVALVELPLKFDIASSRRNNVKILTDGVALVDERQNDRSGTWENKTRREKLFPLQLIEAGLNVQLENAHASYGRDKQHILNCLAQRPLDAEPLSEHPRYVEMNQRLRATFSIAVWRQALLRGLVNTMKLPEKLHSDQMRQSLELSFKYMDKYINEEAILDLERGLPPALRTLSLDFTFCSRLNNRCIACLARPLATPRLGLSLRKLMLSFETCSGVGDGGLAALGQSLPGSLEELEINLRLCASITDAGFAALSNGLPPTMQKINLDMYNCKKVKDGGVAAFSASSRHTALTELVLHLDGCEYISTSGFASLTLGLPVSLETLDLSLEGCDLNDRAVAVFSRGLPTSLKCLPLSTLKLKLRGCGAITSSGVMTISQAFPRQLSILELDFSECGDICDSGISFIANNLPRILAHLKLAFAQCYKITDIGIAAVGENMPSSLQYLGLCFRGCRQITDSGVQSLVKGVANLRKFDADFTSTRVSKAREFCNTDTERPDQWASRLSKASFRDNVEAARPYIIERPVEPECDAKPALPAEAARPTAAPLPIPQGD